MKEWSPQHPDLPLCLSMLGFNLPLAQVQIPWFYPMPIKTMCYLEFQLLLFLTSPNFLSIYSCTLSLPPAQWSHLHPCALIPYIFFPHHFPSLSHQQSCRHWPAHHFAHSLCYHSTQWICTSDWAPSSRSWGQWYGHHSPFCCCYFLIVPRLQCELFSLSPSPVQHIAEASY
jgi:hypothetical protein